MQKVFSKCGMRCDVCIIYRPNVLQNDRREEICNVFRKITPGYEHCGYCDKYPCEIFPAEPSKEELIQKIDVEKQWTWEEELMEAYNCKQYMDAFMKSRK